MWQCGNIADGLLVFSELVTNAVTHAGGASRIVITHGDELLRFDVDDRTHSSPERRAAAGVDGGFGLRIVARLSDGWGWDQTRVRQDHVVRNVVVRAAPTDHVVR